VPVSRLAPKSLEKARRLLDLPEVVSVAPAKVERPKAARVTPPREPVIQAPLPIDELKLAAAQDFSSPGPGDLPPVAMDGGAVDMNLTLPAMADAADSSSDGYGAVLPPRDAVVPSPTRPTGSPIQLLGRTAMATLDLPGTVLTAIEAGNRLQTKYYKWGGGRARLEDTGYDCSGSVSYVLIKAGLLRSPLTSGSFTRYGSPGPGRWITIYARNGHVFMTICGLRLDTGGHGGRGESGPRWRTHMRGTSGFVMRHPPGF
jgi:hypothetical protein